MKLSKLYSNKENFKNIKFNLNGINVIYADVKTKIEDKKNSHNLGKTLVTDLIDFLLLKKIENKKKHFFYKTQNENGDSLFESYIFYLEVLLNSGEYLTIKRSVENNSKISFKIKDSTDKHFNPPLNWDEEEVPLDKAKLLLNQFLNLSFFEDKPYDYRKAINYCLRRQGDYADIYRLKKYSVGKDRDWKPFMFDLLGFNGKLLEDKYLIDFNKDEIKSYTSKLKNEFSVKVEERDELIALIQLKEQESTDVGSQIDKFNFYEQDKQIIRTGVDQIENKIIELNSLSYNLEFEINQLKTSIRNKFTFDIKKVDKVFKETKIYFPDELIKDYEELIKFNEKITIERNKLLKTTLSQKETYLTSIRQELILLNKKKEDLLSFLQDTSIFRKFKEYQKGLVKIESELLKLREKLKTIDKIISKEKENEVLDENLKTVIQAIKNSYNTSESNSLYKEIRSNFSNYYKKILEETAYISWSVNDCNNVEFNPPRVQSEGNIKRDTAQGDGYTYKKLFCVSFDLSILTSYNNQSYYRFVYHDDVLANEDNGVKHRFIELISEILRNYDIQYIFSTIKDDLPRNGSNIPIEFKKGQVVLNLHDKDESGTLFGFKF